MKVIGLAGWSGAGKTTLLSRLVPHLVAEGLRVSTIKHAHHSFDLDTPGKDSWTHRQAGATEVLISSERRFALMHELRGAPELTLRELLPKLSPVDLVIVEGYKTTTPRKIEVHRAQQRQAAALPERPGRSSASPPTVRWKADCRRCISTTSPASRRWSANMRSRSPTCSPASRLET